MCHGTFVRGRGQCMSWLSFSKMWIPGMNLRLSAVASTLFSLLSVLAALNLYSTSFHKGYKKNGCWFSREKHLMLHCGD